MIPIQVNKLNWGLVWPPRTPHKIGPVRFNEMAGRLSCAECGQEILLEMGYPPRGMLPCQCFVVLDDGPTWVDEDIEAHKERAAQFRPKL